MRWRRVAGVALGLGMLGASSGEAGPPVAPTYRWTDDQGNVFYSDRPIPPETLRETGARAVDRALVDELLRASGVERRLPGLAVHMRAEFQRQAGLADIPERQTVAEILARRVSAETLHPLVRDEFHRTASGGHVRDALAWYRAAFGRRVVDLEMQAGTAESQREFRAYTAAVGSHWPAGRVVLVRRIDDAARATETGLDSLVAMLRGFGAAVDAARPPDRRVERAQLETRLKQMRDQNLGPTRQGALVAMLFAYRELSEAELDRYARFMESGAGSWYMRTLNRSLVRAVGVLAERAGAEIVRALPPERWQGAARSEAAR